MTGEGRWKDGKAGGRSGGPLTGRGVGHGRFRGLHADRGAGGGVSLVVGIFLGAGRRVETLLVVPRGFALTF